MVFNLIFRYIDDVLLINNCYFYIYVDLIYFSEFEIKDIIEFVLFVLYLDILLDMDIDGNLIIKFYDKCDDFNFFIVNFFYLCSNIFLLFVYGVFVF